MTVPAVLVEEWRRADVIVHPEATLEVRDLELGRGTIVRKGAELYGERVKLGREAFVDEYAVIGGGSASDGSLEAGDWLHLGMFSQVNTARDVRIGHEVGIGVGSRVFTHGAYLSEWEGFPVHFEGVTIGDRCWLPNAVVMPGVKLPDETVVAAGSVVPASRAPRETGQLLAGTPAEIVGRARRPMGEADRRRVLERIVREVEVGRVVRSDVIEVGSTTFDVAARTIDGAYTLRTERLRNQLRRHGIRFRYEHDGEGAYAPWTEER